MIDNEENQGESIMKRFCKECGKEIQPENRVCIHCGTPVDGKKRVNDSKKKGTSTENVMKQSSSENISQEKRHTTRQTNQTPSAPMSKKKKRMLSIVGGIAVLLIGFSIWAQSYQSPEAVQKRFYKAVMENNPKALQKLVMHENGSSASKGEAKALIKLVEEEGEYVLHDLFTVERDGKFLFLYKAHKMEAADQFVYYPDPVKGLTLSFNEVEPDILKKTLHGPLIPGIYNVQASFKGDYGETTKEGEITLADYYDDETYLDMDINVADVTFYIENVVDLDLENTQIKIGKDEIPINDEGSTKPVGPFILDGSQQVQTVVKMPWGKVESEPIDISEEHMSIQAEVLSEDDYKAVTKLLTNFGEQYVEAFAENNTDPLKNVSKTVKKELKEKMADELFGDWYYSGEFMELNIDRNSIYFNEDEETPSINIVTEYLFNEDYHELEEPPELFESSNLLVTTLNYDAEEKSWRIADISDDYWGAFEGTDTVKGSQKVFGPNDETIKAAKDLAEADEMDDFLESYTRASVDAINYIDFSYMEDYIVEDSPRWEEARDYIDYLDSKNITEDFLDMEIESIDETEDGTWEVTVLESFTIYKEDSTDDKDFRTKLVVKKIDGELFVYELLETNEI